MQTGRKTALECVASVPDQINKDKGRALSEKRLPRGDGEGLFIQVIKLLNHEVRGAISTTANKLRMLPTQIMQSLHTAEYEFRFIDVCERCNIVLLRYPKPTPKPRFFCKNRLSPKPRFFCQN